MRVLMATWSGVVQRAGGRCVQVGRGAVNWIVGKSRYPVTLGEKVVNSSSLVTGCQQVKYVVQRKMRISPASLVMSQVLAKC